MNVDFKTTVTVVHERMLQLGSLCHCIRYKRKGCKTALLLEQGGTKVEDLDRITHAEMKHTVLRMDVLLS